ncbi:MAG: ribbon-helix-helix domain-containing protein [Zestosphaera sp.]
MNEEFRRELEGFVGEVRSRVEELVRRVEKLGSKGDYYRAYKTWSGGITEILRSMRGSLERLSNLARESKLSEEEIRESIEYLKDGLEEVLNKVDYMNERLREYRRKGFEVYVGFTPQRVLRDVFKGIEGSVEGILEGVERAIDSIEESLSSTVARTSQVVSVRLKEGDLDVIDQLVEAGIFKSRSEAVAYFTRKGVEASREWINKALEQARKIKELQDLIRKELRGEDGGVGEDKT